MLDFLTKSVSKLFGNKSERDIRDIQPIIEKIHKASESISQLSHDGLRSKTIEFKQRIQQAIEAENTQMQELRNAIENNPEMEVNKKEKNYDTIDQLKKKILQDYRQILEL